MPLTAQLFFRAQLFIIIIVLIYLVPRSQSSIRVCKRFVDFLVPFSKNCWKYDYDHLDPAQIATTWNFTTETHDLLLDDGYIIGVFRVYKNITKKNPVVLGHGVMTNPLCWVTSGNHSLAYVLGNLGYDVWMVSWRGTMFSQGNVNYENNKTDLHYWKNFTFHQKGIYDLKSTMDLVYNKTHQKAFYIGHSMGTTASFVYCSMLPDLCKERILGLIQMAPVAYLKPIGVLDLLSFYPLPRVLRAILNTPIFKGQLFPRSIFHILFVIRSKFLLGLITAAVVMNSYQGPTFSGFDPKSFPIFIYSLPDSVSAETIYHYVQIKTVERFQQFDFGKNKNLEMYGSKQPPEYPLDQISVPVSLIVAAWDFVVTNKPSEKTYSSLSVNSQCGYHYINKFYNHYDFITNKNNEKLLYAPILKKFQEFERGECIKTH